MNIFVVIQSIKIHPGVIDQVNVAAFFDEEKALLYIAKRSDRDKHLGVRATYEIDTVDVKDTL